MVGTRTVLPTGGEDRRKKRIDCETSEDMDSGERERERESHCIAIGNHVYNSVGAMVTSLGPMV